MIMFLYTVYIYLKKKNIKQNYVILNVKEIF